MWSIWVGQPISFKVPQKSTWCRPSLRAFAERVMSRGLHSSMTAVRPVCWLATRYTPTCSMYIAPRMRFWMAVLTCRHAAAHGWTGAADKELHAVSGKDPHLVPRVGLAVLEGDLQAEVHLRTQTGMSCTPRPLQHVTKQLPLTLRSMTPNPRLR